MAETTAKLKALLEAASPGCDCDPDELHICVHRTEALDHLERIAPDLARLVVTLTEALRGTCSHDDYCPSCEKSTPAERKALADVEELEL